jgi:hypothetical protein
LGIRSVQREESRGPNSLHGCSKQGVVGSIRGDDISCYRVNNRSCQCCDLRLIDPHEAVQPYSACADVPDLKRSIGSEFVLNTSIELLKVRRSVIGIKIGPAQYDTRLNYGITILRNHGGEGVRKCLPERYRSRIERRSQHSVARPPGFATARYNHVTVIEIATSTLIAKLNVAPGAFRVEVNGAPLVVQSASAEVATNLDPRTLAAVPLPTRNFLQLAALAPGVSMPVTDNRAVGRNSPNFSVI